MLYNKLKKYSNSGIYPFHMPGHKRSQIQDSALPYQLDITEIEDFDNLHNASGCIKQIESKAQKIYSVPKAHLLVNGATCGVLAAIRTFTRPNDKVLLARNCHISVYNAVELCHLKPIYIIPQTVDNFGINASISPNEVENLLKSNPDTKLVILTSPTYEGVVSDIKGISQICRNHGVRLFVDEAHGAHFPFSDKFPSEALFNGADAAVVSLHKTLPSLTQTALLLINDIEFDNLFQSNLSIFETSSPSYILMSSIENCLNYVSENKACFEQYTNRLASFYEKCKALNRLKIMYNNLPVDNIFDYDFGKILISTANTELNGKELANILRENYKIETELAYTDYVIAMTSVCDSSDGFDRLANALSEIDKALVLGKHNNSYSNIKLPEIQFYPCQKFDFKSETLSFESSENKASLEYIWAYPPGIPLIVPGEIITKEFISSVKQLVADNIDVISSQKNMPDLICVAKTD